MPVEVLFLTALGLEASAVASHFSRASLAHMPDGRTFVSGELNIGQRAVPVALVETGAGHIQATKATTAAIQALRPRIAVFVGVAAGVKDVGLGDVVVSTKVSILDYGKFHTSGYRPRADQFRSSARIVSAARALRALGRLPSETGPVQIAPTVAVNSVMAGESELTAAISGAFSDAVALSMEDGGFLAAREGTAIEGLVVRGISDLMIDKEAGRDATLQPKVAAAATDVAVAILNEVLSNSLPAHEAAERVALNTALPTDPDTPIGRDDTIREAIHSTGQLTVLTGIAGVGKSTVMARVAHELRSTGLSTLWVRASDPETLSESLRGIGLDMTEDPIAAVQSLVRSDPNVALFLDDMDPTTAGLLVPSVVRGRVFVTSRRPSWPRNWRHVPVTTLGRQEATTLLASLSGYPADDVRDLADFADGLPLALEQIGRYLRATGLPASKYLAALRSRAVEALEVSELGSAAVVAVVDQAMDQLFEADEFAAWLAVVWAHFAPDLTPMLPVMDAAVEGLLPVDVADHLEAAELFRLVAEMGLLTIEGRRAKMHALTGAVIRDRTIHHPARQDILRSAMFAAAFATGDERVDNATADAVVRHVRGLLPDDPADWWLELLLIRDSLKRLWNQGRPADLASEVAAVRAHFAPILAADGSGLALRESVGVDRQQYHHLMRDLESLQGLARVACHDPDGLNALESALDHARQLEDQAAVAASLSELGRGHYMLDDERSAHTLIRQAVAVYAEHDPGCDRHLQDLGNLARICLALGMEEEARRALDEWAQLAAGHEVDEKSVADVEQIRLLLGDDDTRARESLKASADVADGDARLDHRKRSISRHNFAVRLCHEGLFEEALGYLELSLHDADVAWGSENYEHGVRERVKAQVLIELGRLDEAGRSLRRAERIATGNDLERARCDFVAAHLLEASGQIASSLALIEGEPGSPGLAGRLTPSERAEVEALETRLRATMRRERGGTEDPHQGGT